MGQGSSYAALMDVRIILLKEECALSMGQSSNDAARKDARIKFKIMGCASDMGQNGKRGYAALMDAQIKRSEEEYVGVMEVSLNVVLQNAPTMPSMEESVQNMGQKSSSAAVKDVKI
jgi:hypothetical protein